MIEIAHRLTSAEFNVLTDCERRIERGLSTFVDVGVALATIRDDRLYRAEFATFDEYAERRWGFSKGRANQLVRAAAVAELISGTTVSEINNEAQARELAPLLDDPEELREAYTEAVKRTNGKPTASAIRDVVRELTDPESEPLQDKPELATRADPQDDARRYAELDAQLADTATRFRANFSAALARADDVWQFDPSRIAEVYAADFDRSILPFLDEMTRWCELVRARRSWQTSRLRVINGGGK